jgi:signal transduction histidine kinase/PAS domain-containing protein
VSIAPREFVGKTHRDLGFPEAQCLFWEQSIRSVYENGNLLETEFEFEGQNGKVIFSWRLFPEFASDGQVATVISIAHDITKRKRAEEVLRQRNAEMAALNAIAAATSQSLDLEEVLGAALERTLEALDAEGGLIYLFDEAGQSFVPAAYRGISQDMLREVAGFKLGVGLSGRVAESGEALVIADLGSDPRNISPTAGRQGWHSYAGMPIKSKGKLLGVMTLIASRAGHFGSEHVELLSHIGNRVGVAIENARLYQAAQQEIAERKRAEEALHNAKDELERQNARLQALYRVGQMISSTLETDAILDYLVDEAMRITRATHGQVLVVREDLGIFECRSMHGFSAEEEALVRGTSLFLDQGVNGHSYLTRQAVCLDDAPAAPYYFPCVSTTQAELAIPIMREGRVLGNLDLQSPVVGAFRVVDLDYLSALAGQVAVALENANLYGELRQRVAELTALNIVSASVASSLDLRQTLTVVTDYATQLLDVAATSIALKTEGELWFAAASGEGSVLGRRMALGQGITGWVVEHGEALLVPDVSQDPRFFSDFDREAQFTTRSILCVPLQTKGQTIGAIEVINKADDRFGLQDAQLLASLAAPAATAIENARLFEEVRAGRDRLQVLSRRLVEVQEAERRHIARELHDEVGQVLTGLKLTLEMGASLPPEEFKANLEEAQALVNELMAEVRNLSLDLRPAMLDDLGLLPALLWHFERYTAQTQVHVAFKQIGLERRFQPEMETVVYRIIQEALTNVARHAGVSNVTVRVWADEETLNVQVEDQGIGFDPEAALAASASSGLSGMYERVGLLGGQLRIESIPGAGTWLTARLPLSGLGEKEEAKP